MKLIYIVILLLSISGSNVFAGAAAASSGAGTDDATPSSGYFLYNNKIYPWEEYQSKLSDAIKMGNVENLFVPKILKEMTPIQRRKEIERAKEPVAGYVYGDIMEDVKKILKFKETGLSPERSLSFHGYSTKKILYLIILYPYLNVWYEIDYMRRGVYLYFYSDIAKNYRAPAEAETYDKKWANENKSFLYLLLGTLPIPYSIKLTEERFRPSELKDGELVIYFPNPVFKIYKDYIDEQNYERKEGLVNWRRSVEKSGVLSIKPTAIQDHQLKYFLEHGVPDGINVAESFSDDGEPLIIAAFLALHFGPDSPEEDWEKFKKVALNPTTDFHKADEKGLNVLSYAKRAGVLGKIRRIEAEYSKLYADGYIASSIKEVP